MIPVGDDQARVCEVVSVVERSPGGVGVSIFGLTDNISMLDKYSKKKSLLEDCPEGLHYRSFIRISPDQEQLARLAKSLRSHGVEVNTGGNGRAGVIQAVPGDVVRADIVFPSD
jgi:hypothetical protein